MSLPRPVHDDMDDDLGGGTTMRARWRTVVAVLLAAGTLGLGAAIPAAAEKSSDELRLTTTSPGQPVPLLRDESGRYFFQVTIEGELGAFIASWERTKRGDFWTPSDVSLTLKQTPNCVDHEWRKILKPFSSERQMKKSKKWKWEGDELVGLNDEKASAALNACVDVWGEETADHDWAEDKKSSTATIPVDLLGPGTHDLWVTRLERERREFVGSAGDYQTVTLTKTLYKPGTTAKLTVVIPELPFDRATPDGNPAPTRSWFAPTSFSGLTPLPWNEDARVDDGPVAEVSPVDPATQDTEAATEDKAEDKAKDKAKPTIAVGQLTPVVHIVPVQMTAGLVSPERPAHLLWALVAGLGLALVIAVPSWSLERSAARGDGRLSRIVKASFAPTSAAPAVRKDATPDLSASAETASIEGDDRP